MISLSDFDLSKLTPEEIGEILINAKKAYYTTSKPIMDDHTYDTLEEVLLQKSPHHRIFSKVGNPNFDTGFDKKKHIMPMGSQNKVHLLTDLVHYFELKKIDIDTDFIVQPKCDGISLEIEFKDGKIIDAITRGDGLVGDIITQNVVKMKNLPLASHTDFSGSVRCEIVVTQEDFKKINSIVETNVETLRATSLQNNYSNPRNAASGISQRLDSKYSEYCSLYATDIFTTNQKPFETEADKINFLKHLGFIPVDSWTCTRFDQIENIYQKFLKQDRSDYPYDIDGLVIKINSLEIQKELGIKNGRPKGQVAYKFPASTDQTRILEVDWQVGPLGMVTPVAKVEPVEISGAIITYASLANYQLIIDKNINIGDIVEISRRGDVIPHIEGVVSKVTNGHLQYPTVCPSCGTNLIVESKFIRCPNSLGCPSQVLGGLNLFCKALEIKGISSKTILKLSDIGKVKLPGDFYDLTINDFENLEGLGEKSGTNIVKQIQAKKTLTLKQVLEASSIPNFSSARIQQIIDAGFNTPEKILNISSIDLEPLPGVQITLAEKITSGIQSKKTTIQSILDHVQIKQDDSKISDKLSGLTFCITGSLSRPRKDIEDDITANGGKVANSVTSNTSYLISNETESDSSKFVSAKKLGVPIITENQFDQLINRTPDIPIVKDSPQASLF